MNPPLPQDSPGIFGKSRSCWQIPELLHNPGEMACVYTESLVMPELLFSRVGVGGWGRTARKFTGIFWEYPFVCIHLVRFWLAWQAMTSIHKISLGSFEMYYITVWDASPPISSSLFKMWNKIQCYAISSIVWEGHYPPHVRH